MEDIDSCEVNSCGSDVDEYVEAHEIVYNAGLCEDCEGYTVWSEMNYNTWKSEIENEQIYAVKRQLVVMYERWKEVCIDRLEKLVDNDFVDEHGTYSKEELVLWRGLEWNDISTYEIIDNVLQKIFKN